MSDPHRVKDQLIQLLKIPVLPEGSFSSTLSQNAGPPSDKDATNLNEEYGRLVIATDQLKRSNAVPQVMETETIGIFQKKCAGDIARDDDYIQYLQLQINGLLGELRDTRIRRSQVQNMLDYFKPICSPIRRLPPEILATIFHFCLSTNAGPYTGAPLDFCHVSSFWRSVALGSQNLWSRLSLNFGWTSASKYNEISNFWFLHSRNQPRSLRYHHMSNRQWLPGPPQAFTDITTSSRLLRNLSCIDFDPEQLLPFLQLHSSYVPLLEVVRLVSAIRFPRIVETTVLEAAPCLRIVHLKMSTPLFTGTLPWSQLTWLKIQDPMDITHWAAALQQCVQLQYGYFNVQDLISQDFDWENFSLTLRHLEALFLTIGDAWDLFENTFKNFNLPSLQHLSVNNLFHDAFAHPSFFHLTPCRNLLSLCFQNIFIEQDIATSMFIVTPKLKHLALDISTFDYHSILTLLHQNREMLPHLSDLRLVMAYDDVVSDPETICAVITSRFHSGFLSPSHLRHVSLFLWQDEDDIESKDDFELTASVEVDNLLTMIMNTPFSPGVDLRVRVVLQPPGLGDIVEKIWCEPPKED